MFRLQAGKSNVVVCVLDGARTSSYRTPNYSTRVIPAVLNEYNSNGRSNGRSLQGPGDASGWDVQLNVLQHGSCLAVQRRVLARSGTGVEAQLFGT